MSVYKLREYQEVCRFCENLSPREDYFYGHKDMWMCYEYRDSNDCSPDYKSSKCDKFEISKILAEVLDCADKM